MLEHEFRKTYEQIYLKCCIARSGRETGCMMYALARSIENVRLCRVQENQRRILVWASGLSGWSSMDSFQASMAVENSSNKRRK